MIPGALSICTLTVSITESLLCLRCQIQKQFSAGYFWQYDLHLGSYKLLFISTFCKINFSLINLDTEIGHYITLLMEWREIRKLMYNIILSKDDLKTRGPLVLYLSPETECWGYVKISGYWGKEVKHSPWAGADNPLGPKILCQQEGLITMVICCKFKKKLFNLWLYTHLFMI